MEVEELRHRLTQLEEESKNLQHARPRLGVALLSIDVSNTRRLARSGR